MIDKKTTDVGDIDFPDIPQINYDKKLLIVKNFHFAMYFFIFTLISIASVKFLMNFGIVDQIGSFIESRELIVVQKNDMSVFMSDKEDNKVNKANNDAVYQSLIDNSEKYLNLFKNKRYNSIYNEYQRAHLLGSYQLIAVNTSIFGFFQMRSVVIGYSAEILTNWHILLAHIMFNFVAFLLLIIVGGFLIGMCLFMHQFDSLYILSLLGATKKQICKSFKKNALNLRYYVVFYLSIISSIMLFFFDDFLMTFEAIEIAVVLFGIFISSIVLFNLAFRFAISRSNNKL